MGDGSTQDNVWPLPKFYFQVKWDSEVVEFEEVSGLNIEAQVIEYRHGDSPEFSTIKMPGLKKVSNVTMKKGVFKSDNKFWLWLQEVNLNTIKRKVITISLLDEKANPTMTWTLNNAFPTKITGTDLKSNGNEIAVESIDVAFETMTIGNP